MNKNSLVAILGAGPCGLATAWALIENGFSNVVVLEKNNNVGGIVRSEIINGNAYEYGAHYFHSDDKEILDKVTGLLNGVFSINKRNLIIKFNGKYFQYPLKVNDLISGFKFQELFLLFLSMACAFFKNKIFPKKLISAQDVLVTKYGKRLYKKFFEGYIVNFWSIHPSQLSANFALRRIPRLDAIDFLKKIISIFKKSISTNKQDEFIEVVKGDLYYPHQGMSEIWNKIAAKITANKGRIYTGINIKSICNIDSSAIKSISFENKEGNESIYPDIVVNTIPIPVFLNYFTDCSKQIRDIAEKLKYRSLIIFGILVAKDKILPSYCVYFHDHIFGRISEPKQAGLVIRPAHYTVLLVEISCNFNDEFWRNTDGLVEKVYNELEEEMLLKREEIKETHILKERFAYPVFDLDYEENIGRIGSYLLNFENVFSTGRQGLFQYVNAHLAIRMGFNTANSIIEKKSKVSNRNKALYF